MIKLKKEGRKETYFNIINAICNKPTSSTTRMSRRDYMYIQKIIE